MVTLMPRISCEVHSLSLSASLKKTSDSNGFSVNKVKPWSPCQQKSNSFLPYSTFTWSIKLVFFLFLWSCFLLPGSLPTCCNHLDILGLGEAQPPELQSVIADETLPGPWPGWRNGVRSRRRWSQYHQTPIEPRKKGPGLWLFWLYNCYIGDYLPSYMGILLNNFVDPY